MIRKDHGERPSPFNERDHLSELAMNMTTDTHRTPEKKVPAWPASSLAERLIHCRIMLYQHGILTDAEKDRADARLGKLIQKEKASG